MATLRVTLILFGVGIFAAAAGHPGPLAVPDPPPAAAAPNLSGVDFSGLSGEQVALAMQILGETHCNCGCGMTLAECRTKDPKCSRSLSLARGVVQDLKDGKDKATVVSNLNAALAKAATPAPAAAAPDANKVYPIDVTGAPVRGPKAARVAVVVFSDYQ